MKNLTPEKQQATQHSLTQKEIEALRIKNSKLVRGRFRDYEVPGGTLQFSVGPIYKGDPTWTYSHATRNALVDGEIYDLPRAVAIHLNKNCWYPEFEHAPSESFIGEANLNGSARMSRRVHRFGFQSLEFDGEDISPTPILFTVEKTL